MIVWAVLAIVLIYGILSVKQNSSRSAEDVLFDLSDLAEADNETQISQKGLKIFSDELGKIGIFDPKERRRFLLTQKLLPVIFVALPLLILGILGKSEPAQIFASSMVGWGVGYITVRRMAANRREKYQKALEYHLPLVMERIVMAVEAGLDIVSALQNIIKLENEGLGEGLADIKEIDPVTRLLEVVMALSDAGLRFETALYDTANVVDNSSIKHAFIHLALAYKEGGELIMPLRELSDATQLQYQEILEEEIAALPIKATMPLVLVFAGLVICFLTGPIVQIIKTMGEAMPQ